jgi:hypothetical protein
MSDIPSFPYRLLWGERTVSSVANLTRADGEAFMALAERIRVHVRAVRYPLERANELLRCQPSQFLLERHAFDLGRYLVSNRPHHCDRVEPLLHSATHQTTPLVASESRASDSPDAGSRAPGPPTLTTGPDLL